MFLVPCTVQLYCTLHIYTHTVEYSNIYFNVETRELKITFGSCGANTKNQDCHMPHACSHLKRVYPRLHTFGKRPNLANHTTRYIESKHAYHYLEENFQDQG